MKHLISHLKAKATVLPCTPYLESSLVGFPGAFVRTYITLNPPGSWIPSSDFLSWSCFRKHYHSRQLAKLDGNWQMACNLFIFFGFVYGKMSFSWKRSALHSAVTPNQMYSWQVVQTVWFLTPISTIFISFYFISEVGSFPCTSSFVTWTICGPLCWISCTQSDSCCVIISFSFFFYFPMHYCAVWTHQPSCREDLKFFIYYYFQINRLVPLRVR